MTTDGPGHWGSEGDGPSWAYWVRRGAGLGEDDVSVAGVTVGNAVGGAVGNVGSGVTLPERRRDRVATVHWGGRSTGGTE